MECETSDSKKLFKVFEASKRRKCRRKREVLDDSMNSQGTMESNNINVHSVKSAKAILSTAQGDAPPPDMHAMKRDNSPDASASPLIEIHRPPRSPRRCRRTQQQGVSLALKAGLVSTPRSNSPQQEEEMTESVPHDQDSFIYAFLEEALKKDKKYSKQKHGRSRDNRPPSGWPSPDRDASLPRDQRHRHHHHRRRRSEYGARNDEVDQALLMETFAKLCVQMNERVAQVQPQPPKVELARTHSHKSLQCQVESRRDVYMEDMDQRPTKLGSIEPSRENIPVSRRKSHDDVHETRSKIRTPSRSPSSTDRKNFCCSHHTRGAPKYPSKMNFAASKMQVFDDRYRQYASVPHCRPDDEHGFRNYDSPDRRTYREYDDRRGTPTRDRRAYDDKRVEQKTSRSFDVHRDCACDDRNRRTSRSDCNRRRLCEELRDPRDKRYDDRRELRDIRERKIDDRRDKYYEDNREFKERHFSNLPSRDRRSRRNLDHFEKNSVASRDDDVMRDRDRYSERERESVPSVADGDTSTVSGRSNYLKVVKQEIAEQREAMDKMMKLWKELMRCFKGINSQNQGQEKAVQESAANMQESAAAQLRLWRECMRRYETVARDVGDTDARLMEEINKQRSEMAEMVSMWQECLQRYRDISSDFNNLKQKLATTESSPSRHPAPAPPPMMCADVELPVHPAHPAHPAHPTPYRLPPTYAPPPAMAMGGYGGAGAMGGSPLRSRASMPPAWWWCQEQGAPPPRRRSSPDSRGSRDRDRRRHKDRDDTRYKKETTKPNAARSEHKHRKR